MDLRGLARPLRAYGDAALEFARSAGAKITVTSVRRPLDQQAALYQRYLDCRNRGEPTPPCAYPAVPAGFSGHNYGLAWDSVIHVPAGEDGEAWQRWWDLVRRAYGWEVPGNDRIHAQVPGWAAHREDWISWARTVS